ncbi:hypothetical protein JCM8547_005104 [Rhodosporidiobolus lusitaniae]
MASPAPPSASTSTTPAPAAGGLDTAKLLVQKVARTFYGVKGAILADQLVRKECFRDEEISKRLGLQPKDIAKIAHRLVEDGIVQIHRRSEMRDNGALKAQQRTYYYLDYSKATDAIKWRMWKVQQTIDVKLRNELDAQGYVCPLCKASYTPLDAASLFDPSRNLLACSVCQTEVTNNENEEEVKGNKDRMQRLNRQTKGLVDALKGLEREVVPRFDIESYLLLHGPALGQTALFAAEAAGTLPAQAQVVKVHLAGDDDEAREKERREEETRRKREQNALPSWIAQSTVEGGRGEGEREKFSVTAVPGLGATMRLGDEDAKPLLAASGEEEQEDDGGADLDAYYASLAAQPPAAEEYASAGTEGVEAEDFSSFSASATPALGSGEFGGAGGSPATLQGSATPFDGEEVVAGGAKREREESTGSNLFDGDSSAKRARLDSTFSIDPSLPPDGSPSLPPPPPTAAAEPTPAPEAEKDEFEDDDDFEEADGGEGADPNQLISVNGEMKKFSEVTEEMTGEMTADEYSAYWDVYQRVND